MRKFSFESMEPANTDCLIAKKKKGGGGRGNKRDFGHLRQKKKRKELKASLHFKLDNPLNQVKHVARSSSSKGDNQ